MTATSVVRLGTKAAADYLGGLPESTLRYWLYMGTGPRSYRLGRHMFYDIADLDAWLEAEAAKTERGRLTSRKPAWRSGCTLMVSRQALSPPRSV